MQLWNSKARRIPNEILGRVIPIEILYEFDWPITFTFQCELGTFLAHLVTVNDRGFRHIAVPAKESDVAKLKNGSSSVRMAFDQPLVWVFECDPEWRVQFAATVPGIEYLPDGWVPAGGVMLYPDLEPLLRVRILGVMDNDGLVGAELLRSLVSRVQKMMRSLADLSKPKLALFSSHGPIEELLKLRTQQVAFKSLEVAFREPDREYVNQHATDNSELDAAYEIFAEVRTLLNRGLEWARGNSPAPEDMDIESQRRLLNAVKQLSPTGTEDEVELSGRLLDIGPRSHLLLARDDSKKIMKELRRLRHVSTIPVVEFGIVDEFDYGDFTFTLRHTESGAERRFRYGAVQRERVLRFFEGREMVKVTGSKRPSDKIVELAEIQATEQ